MPKYYVNKNPQSGSGDNEVHKYGCYWLSLVVDREYLGNFTSCDLAVVKTLLNGYKANGCKHCSPECHAS